MTEGIMTSVHGAYRGMMQYLCTIHTKKIYTLTISTAKGFG